MRRALAIFLQFTLKTGHEHPHRRAAINHYTRLLAAMGRSEAEIEARLEEIGHPFGVRRGVGPSAETAPSPG